MQETAEQRFIMQFTTAIKMSPKQSHWLVAWRAHRWSIFPAERECVVAHLMLLVFFELKSLRRCVPFHLVWLIACVYVSAFMCAFVCAFVCERERENDCVFQVEGQLLSLLLSIQQPSSLWQGLREALFRCCRGVDAGWLDVSFQNHFSSKAQHMDDKLFCASSKEVAKRYQKYICLFVKQWEEEILYNRKQDCLS